MAHIKKKNFKNKVRIASRKWKDILQEKIFHYLVRDLYLYYIKKKPLTSIIKTNQLKMGTLSKQFSKENTQIADNHMKRYWISLASRQTTS